MEAEFHGANCLSFNNKSIRIVVDDNLASLGAKSITKAHDVAVFTGLHGLPGVDTRLVIDSPGEYEIGGVSIIGIPARAHLEDKDVKNTTMYKILTNNVRLLVTGHIYPELSDDQLEQIGVVDVLFIPVGGNGYTLDPTGALSLIKSIEPHAVVLTHYDDKALTYEMPQQDLDQALKTISMDPVLTAKKLKLKSGEFAEGSTDLILLEKS